MPGEGEMTDAWKYSGTISTNPATLMTMAIKRAHQPGIFFDDFVIHRILRPQPTAGAGSGAVRVSGTTVLITL